MTLKKDTCCFTVTVNCNINPVQVIASTKRKGVASFNENIFQAKISPNPSNLEFTVKTFTENSKMKINMRVLDIYGRTIEIKQNIAPNTTTQFGGSYSRGIYFTEIIQGKRKIVIKMIKQ
jgi:hypothetical protein